MAIDFPVTARVWGEIRRILPHLTGTSVENQTELKSGSLDQTLIRTGEFVVSTFTSAKKGQESQLFQLGKKARVLSREAAKMSELGKPEIDNLRQTDNSCPQNSRVRKSMSRHKCG